MVQSLQAVQPKICRSDGPLAVVIVPTREVQSAHTMRNALIIDQSDHQVSDQLLSYLSVCLSARPADISDVPEACEGITDIMSELSSSYESGIIDHNWLQMIHDFYCEGATGSVNNNLCVSLSVAVFLDRPRCPDGRREEES